MRRMRRDESTGTDRDEQLHAGFQPLRCTGCATEVRVRKRSADQTSVQWHTDAAAGCPDLARRTRDGSPAAQCPVLRATIRDAFAAGLIRPTNP